MISISNISKSYNDVLVVDGINLDIPKGKVTTIIGPNGAGKSTLLSMMARLLSMNAGQVRVDGLDVTTTRDDVLARKLSILRQENNIASRLTVEDLVIFGRYPYSKGRTTTEDKEFVDRAISFLNLDNLRSRYLDQLSGGQRQRAYVAMVLAQETEYLLLDEPLNNLDMKHAVEMMKLIRRAASEFGKTIIVVLHDINFASCYSDQIIVMKEGKLTHQGAPSSIITPEIIKEIYEIDITVHEISGQLISVYYK